MQVLSLSVPGVAYQHGDIVAFSTDKVLISESPFTQDDAWHGSQKQCPVVQARDPTVLCVRPRRLACE